MRTHRPRSTGPAMQGVTLVEMLIVVLLLAIFARVMVPNLAGNEDRRLDVAASEVRESLRFARSEALRRGQKVLFDAESSPGHVKILVTPCTSFGSPKAVNDPRTKLSYDVNIADGPFSGGVGVTPQFIVAGSAWGGVVFDANGEAVDACQVTGMNSKGTPEAGSKVLLSLAGRQLSVALDPPTGRVTGP